MARRLITDTCIIDDNEDYIQLDSTPTTSPESTPVIKRKPTKKNIHELTIKNTKFTKQRYHKISYIVGGEDIFKGTIISKNGVKTKITIRDPTIIKFSSLDNEVKLAKRVRESDEFVVNELIEGRRRERETRRKKLQRRHAFYCNEQLENSPVETNEDVQPKKRQKIN